MILDRSYFTGKLFIPNVQAVPDIHGGTQPNNQDKLTDAIAKYERLMLVNAIGITQYEALVAAIDTPDYIEGNIWYDLVNGKTYDNKRYEGLKPLIAYYVYVNFLKYDVVQYNTTGLQRSNAANAVNVTNRERIVDYWNTFVNMYQYPMGFGCGVNTAGNFVSLRQYLYDYREVYNVDYFGYYQIQNDLGI